MVGVDEQEIQVQDPPDLPEFRGAIYKRWHRKGFISITPWLEAGRFTIDIGAIDVEKKTKTSNTLAYVKAIDFAAYLRAVVLGSAPTIYPAGQDKMAGDLPSPESFIVYGGSNTKEGPVSRIFKIHQWNSNGNLDPSAFAWKIGLFKAATTNTGAFIAKRDQPIQYDLIKIPRDEMHRIQYAIDLSLQHHVANNDPVSLNPGG